MKSIDLRLGKILKKNKIERPKAWRPLGERADHIHFLGTQVYPAKHADNAAVRARIKSFKVNIQLDGSSPAQRIEKVINEMVRCGVVVNTERYQAIPLVREWMKISYENAGKPSLYEDWIRGIFPAFLSEKEPSVSSRAFCFLLDNDFIPRNVLTFQPELEKFLQYYSKYRFNPSGISDKEKRELSDLIDLFTYLQLNGDSLLLTLKRAVVSGIGIDSETTDLPIDKATKISIVKDEFRWRILRALRWTSTEDKELIETMKLFVDSPNWSERVYAIGFLGKAAGRLYRMDPVQCNEILTFLLTRLNEILAQCPPYQHLEVVKSLLGDWDARQPYLRHYLSDNELSIQGLLEIAKKGSGEMAVRRNAVQGLSIFAALKPDGPAKQALLSLKRSKSLLCRSQAGLALGHSIAPVEKRIIITDQERLKQAVQSAEHYLSFNRSLYPYSRLNEWLFLGMSLGRGMNFIDLGIHDGKWLAVRKIAPSTQKLPQRRVIPAIERITSVLGHALGLSSLGIVQLVEDAESRDNYFSYSVGQFAPLSPDQYLDIKSLLNFQANAKVEDRAEFERMLKGKLAGIYREKDMDSEEMAADPVIGGIIQANRAGSTLAFASKDENKANEWYKDASRIFSNPELLDQVKFFNLVTGNEDQYGYRNLLLTRSRREGERIKLSLIDFAYCFPFLHRKHLDWREQLAQFHVSMNMIAKEAPPVFINNIKPVIINMLMLPDQVIKKFLDELQYMILTPEEKNAVYMLLLAEKDDLARHFVRLQHGPSQ